MLRPLLQRPEAMLVSTFAGLILAGTVVLCLPISATGPTLGWVDSLFTATSAVCVTGLIVVDTATFFTRTGQTTILLLIQLGGLGLMTFSVAIFYLLGRRLSLGSQSAVHETFFQSQKRGSLRSAILRVVGLTFLIEAAGVLLLWWARRADAGLFEALFLAVSAFCNAGFSVYSDSVTTVCRSGLASFVLMGLITLGGLGYAVLFETLDRAGKALQRIRSTPVVWSLNSRVVYLVSGCLALGGAAALWTTGLGLRDAGLLDTLHHALFQSVSARTAGFNTIDIGAIPVPGLMILILLMFIGGSPGSCAGGIKTTSLAVWLARVYSRTFGREDVVLYERRIPDDVIRRATEVIALAALWNAAGILLLAITEDVPHKMRLEQIIFEQVSAFCTVGLSTGITPALSTTGKLWLTATMFAGRLGPLTLALAVLPKGGAPLVRYPTERVMIG